MKLNMKLINNYSNEEFYSNFYEIIEAIKKEVDYIEIDENLLNYLTIYAVKENIKKIKRMGKTKFIIYMVKIVKDKMRIYSILNNVEIKNIEPFDLNNLDKDNSNELEKSNLTYFLEKIESPILTPNEEKECLKQIKLGNLKVKNFFIERNLKLVVMISRKYLGCGLDWEELIQEGTIGLMEAIDKFNIEKNVKFSTYATWWIRQRIQRSIEEYARIIKLSSNRLIQIKKYKKLKETIENRSDINLSIELLCETFNIKYKSALRLYYMEKDVLHFEDILNNDELVKKYKFNNLCEDTTPSDIYKLKVLKEAVNSMLNKVDLTDTEYEVIKLKYGFDGYEPLTNREISKKLNYTVSWISYAEISAMQKIWKSKEVEKLLIYSKNRKAAKQLVNYYREFYSDPKNIYKTYKKVNNLDFKNKKM